MAGLNVGVGAVDEAVDRNTVGTGVGKVAKCKQVGVIIRLHLVGCDVGIGGVLKAGVGNFGEQLLWCTCSCAWLLFLVACPHMGHVCLWVCHAHQLHMQPCLALSSWVPCNKEASASKKRQLCHSRP